MTFDEVYRTHHSTVLRAAVRVVGRRDLAEEITADAFLELYRRLDRIDTDRLPGWLITVARNRAMDYWRRRQLERRLVEVAPQIAPAADRLPQWFEEMLAHSSLKAVHRTCLALRYLEGLTRSEIGARLGLSVTQVRGHLQYSLILLRNQLV